MAGSSKEAWDEVGERFAVFGRALAARYKQLEQERGTTTDEDKRKIEEAFSTITRQFDQAFTSLGDTIRDPSAKDDLKAAARSVGDALTVTYQEVSGEIRKRVGRGGDAETPPEPPDGSTAEGGSAPPKAEDDPDA